MKRAGHSLDLALAEASLTPFKVRASRFAAWRIVRAFGAVILMGWQASAWLFWPPDEPFPNETYVPLLAVSALSVSLFAWLRRKPQRNPARRRRTARALVISAVVTMAVISASYATFRTRVLSGIPDLHRSGYAQLMEVSQSMQDCIVACEDRRFYQHSGVDWVALHRAVRIDIRAGDFSHGGSTITMQATRYAFLSTDKSVWRKLCEIPMALCVDRLMTKDDVLVLYLGNTYFGLHAVGIRDAARKYFGKEAKDLSLAESAFLAALPARAPNSEADVTPAFVEQCRDQALDRLGSYLPLRYSATELEQARAEPLVFAWEKKSAQPVVR